MIVNSRIDGFDRFESLSNKKITDTRRASVIPGLDINPLPVHFPDSKEKLPD